MQLSGTVVCIASGPSLSGEDCETVRVSGLPTIVTNSTFRMCYWAQALFGFDYPWWKKNIDDVRLVFRGRLFCPSPLAPKMGVEDSSRVTSFGMSGTGAVAMAIVSGAERVVLLGYDSQLTNGLTHHHGDHAGLPNCDSISKWPGRFSRLARFAERSNVPVVNASRETSLTMFPRSSLADAL